MKVYQRLAAAFAAEGASHVFGIMGEGNIYWINALAKLGVQTVEVRHEGAGLGMADGWARLTRNPGIATTTCGPGVTQLGTALVTASRAESPLVVFCGEFPNSDPEYNQRLDQARFAAACETGFVRVATADAADEAVRKAFYLARTESRPIMLSAPIDVQQKDFEDDDAYQPSSTILPVRSAGVNPAVLEAAADLIAGSRKPVIVVGRGALWSGAGDAVRKLAARSGALIITSLMAKNWLNEDEFHIGISGSYATRTAIDLCSDADCVIAVGASMNRYTTGHGYHYPSAKFVQIDIKPHVLMYGLRTAECYLQADAKAGVEALDAMLAKRSFSQSGYRTPEVKARLATAFEDRTQYADRGGTARPAHGLPRARRGGARRDQSVHRQRLHRRLFQHAVQPPAPARDARLLLRLHRPDDADRDRRDAGAWQQAGAAGRRRRQHDDAPGRLRDGGAPQGAAADRRPEQPEPRHGVPTISTLTTWTPACHR